MHKTYQKDRAMQCSGAARVQHHGAVPRAMLGTVSGRTEPGVIRHEAVQTPALEQHDCQAGTPQMASLLGNRTEKQSLCHGKNTSFCAGTKFCPKYFSSMKGRMKGPSPSNGCSLQPLIHPKYITEDLLKNKKRRSRTFFYYYYFDLHFTQYIGRTDFENESGSCP